MKNMKHTSYETIPVRGLIYGFRLPSLRVQQRTSKRHIQWRHSRKPVNEQERTTRDERRNINRLPPFGRKARTVVQKGIYLCSLRHTDVFRQEIDCHCRTYDWYCLHIVDFQCLSIIIICSRHECDIIQVSTSMKPLKHQHLKLL